MKALVFGGSGLVGRELLALLSADMSFSEIISAGRSVVHDLDDRIQQLTINMEALDTQPELFESDIVFCCLGTTIGKAGSKEAFELVDLHYVSRIAQMAAAQGVACMAVISSMGADPTSYNFYLRTKGRMEQAVCATHIPHIIIARPGLLRGKRNEFRFAEKTAAMLLPVIEWMMIGSLKNYRSINAIEVAAALIQAGKERHNQIIRTHELKLLAKKYLSA